MTAYRHPLSTNFVYYIIAALLAILSPYLTIIDYKVPAIIFIGCMLFFSMLIIINNNFYYIFIFIIIANPFISFIVRLSNNDSSLVKFGVQVVMGSFIVIPFFATITKRFNFYHAILKRDYIFIFMLAYLFANILSFLVNPVMKLSTSAIFIYRFFVLICIYILSIVEFNNQKKIDYLLFGIIYSVISLNLLGIYQISNGIFNTDRHVKAVFSAFSHPNMYGNYIIIANVICLFLIKTTRSVVLKFFLYILLASNGYLISQTYSRTAIVIFLLVTLCWVIQNRTFFILPYLLILCLLILFYFPDIVNYWTIRFNTLFKINKYALDSTEFTSGRNLIFSKLIELFFKNPILGIGPQVFYPYYCSYAMPHNELLRNLAEVGSFGTINFVLYWGSMVKMVTMEYFKTKDAFPLMAIYILFVIFTINLTSNSGTTPEIVWPMMMVVGAVRNLNKKNLTVNA